MREEMEIRQAIETYSDMVKRICFVYMKNAADAEDVFQDVFLKYALFPDDFKSKEHEKSWLIRVAINRCKDVLKSFSRKNVYSLEEVWYIPASTQSDHIDLLQAIHKLPEKYRILIYLFYFEGYTAVEIAKVLHKNVNTIYTNLSRARVELKELLGGDYLEQ